MRRRPIPRKAPRNGRGYHLEPLRRRTPDAQKKQQNPERQPIQRGRDAVFAVKRAHHAISHPRQRMEMALIFALFSKCMHFPLFRARGIWYNQSSCAEKAKGGELHAGNRIDGRQL